MGQHWCLGWDRGCRALRGLPYSVSLMSGVGGPASSWSLLASPGRGRTSQGWDGSSAPLCSVEGFWRSLTQAGKLLPKQFSVVRPPIFWLFDSGKMSS